MGVKMAKQMHEKRKLQSQWLNHRSGVFVPDTKLHQHPNSAS